MLLWVAFLFLVVAASEPPVNAESLQPAVWEFRCSFPLCCYLKGGGGVHFRGPLQCWTPPWPVSLRLGAVRLACCILHSLPWPLLLAIPFKFGNWPLEKNPLTAPSPPQLFLLLFLEMQPRCDTMHHCDPDSASAVCSSLFPFTALVCCDHLLLTDGEFVGSVLGLDTKF